MKYYAVERSGPYLAHHGILGQKWGIRRYQNKDGSLTAAGKKRYRDMTTDEFDKEVYDYMNERSHKGLIRSSFEKARDQVLVRCSNEIGPLKREGLHMSEVGDRGQLSPSETKQVLAWVFICTIARPSSNHELRIMWLMLSLQQAPKCMVWNID